MIITLKNGDLNVKRSIYTSKPQTWICVNSVKICKQLYLYPTFVYTIEQLKMSQIILRDH